MAVFFVLFACFCSKSVFRKSKAAIPARRDRAPKLRGLAYASGYLAVAAATRAGATSAVTDLEVRRTSSTGVLA